MWIKMASSARMNCKSSSPTSCNGTVYKVALVVADPVALAAVHEAARGGPPAADKTVRVVAVVQVKGANVPNGHAVPSKSIDGCTLHGGNWPV